MSLPRANIAFPTRYRLGWGRRSELIAEVRTAGIGRALVVSDPGVAALPWFSELIASVANGGVPTAVFTGVSSNPTEVEVLAGVAAFADHRADGVVAIGGGSAMDAAKAIALLAGHSAGRAAADGGPAGYRTQKAAVAAFAAGDIAAFAVGGSRARAIRGDAVPPIIAVPTTAGTGSELSPGAVVTDPGAGVKRTLVHSALLPRCVIADPETTAALPPHLTAATGMDALTHALEALCATGYHPMCDGIAVETVRLIAEYLPRAVASGDAEARTHMLMAAGMAAVAFQKGLGLVHAMAHPLGAVTGVHHGLANAVLLPHVLDVNREAIADPCARVAAVLGLAGPDPAAAVRAWVSALTARIGIPPVLPVPATDALVERLTQLALGETMYLATNPRPIAASDIAGVYRRALGC